MMANSDATSVGVSVAVGSSRMIMRLREARALAISSSWSWAMPSSSARVVVGTASPTWASRSRARACMARRSTSPNRLGGSSMVRFSATLTGGRYCSSWCTTRIPAPMASRGVAGRYGAPSSSMVPLSGV
jgi:hypothetical protein